MTNLCRLVVVVIKMEFVIGIELKIDIKVCNIKSNCRIKLSTEKLLKTWRTWKKDPIVDMTKQQESGVASKSKMNTNDNK